MRLYYFDGIRALWVTALLAAFVVLFPDLASDSLGVDRKIARFAGALLVTAASVVLSEHYFRWSRGLV